MPDCQCERIESKFDEPYAAEKLDLYREEGPDPSTQALIDAITADDVVGRSLLDIGGGVGAVQHALIEAGVSDVQEVEASPAYAAASCEEAARLGHDDRITHFLGDLASVADQVRPADIVTLDRSLCCWHDMPSLAGNAARLATWRMGLVYPRDVWWVRYGWRVYSNLRQALNHNAMRVFSHRRKEVEAVLAEQGLRPHAYSEVGVWQVAVYARERP